MFWGLIEPSVYKKIWTSRARAAERRHEPVSVVCPAHTVCICMFSWCMYFFNPGNILHCLNNHIVLPQQSLQPIDKLFLFLMYLAAGLKERDLANRFSIHQSTVSRIVIMDKLPLHTPGLCVYLDRQRGCRSSPPWGVQRIPGYSNNCGLHRAQMPDTIFSSTPEWDVLVIQISLHHEGTD